MSWHNPFSWGRKTVAPVSYKGKTPKEINLEANKMVGTIGLLNAKDAVAELRKFLYENFGEQLRTVPKQDESTIDYLLGTFNIVEAKVKKSRDKGLKTEWAGLQVKRNKIEKLNRERLAAQAK